MDKKLDQQFAALALELAHLEVSISEAQKRRRVIIQDLERLRAAANGFNAGEAAAKAAEGEKP